MRDREELQAATHGSSIRNFFSHRRDPCRLPDMVFGRLTSVFSTNFSCLRRIHSSSVSALTDMADTLSKRSCATGNKRKRGGRKTSGSKSWNIRAKGDWEKEDLAARSPINPKLPAQAYPFAILWQAVSLQPRSGLRHWLETRAAACRLEKSSSFAASSALARDHHQELLVGARAVAERSMPVLVPAKPAASRWMRGCRHWVTTRRLQSLAW